MNIKYIIKEIIGWIALIAIAIVIALTIKFFLISPTIVQQISMYPTLENDQRLILSRLIRTAKQEPNRGDIITFEAPYLIPDISNENPIAQYINGPDGKIGKFMYYVFEIGKQSYIKRVIGLPGEEIEIKDGNVYINGEELEEEYLEENVTTSLENENLNHFTVPEGSVFVMGDNRDYSLDSRTFGCIPINKIEGKVAFRFWPLSKFGGI